MLTFATRKGAELCTGATRRDFLRAGALSAGAIGLSLADWSRLAQAGAAGNREVNCILLFLVGGPSQLDTWDPKPNAPSDVRGPFRSICTDVPGINLSEHFPRMARMADRLALVRSMHHEEAPIHETGHQLMQTGRLTRGGFEYPHFGSVVSRLLGPRAPGVPPFVVLPRPIGNTGVSVSHGQGAGFLGGEHAPFIPEDGGAPARTVALDPSWFTCPSGIVEAVDVADRANDAAQPLGDNAANEALDQVFSARAKNAFALAQEAERVRDRYGRNSFGQACLLARRLVEGGVRLVTVNMFDTVFNTITWDCHADGGSLPTTLDDYRTTLCPTFDQAYTALIEDLSQRGLLANTLVVAMGEFGRTPHLNPRGGRDHWPGCWTILFAGAGIKGGQVIGASDAIGGEPANRPVSPAEVAASVYHALGIDGAHRLIGPDGQRVPLAQAKPIGELF
jgi:uncharacterized protein (DUF1501 family)